MCNLLALKSSSNASLVRGQVGEFTMVTWCMVCHRSHDSMSPPLLPSTSPQRAPARLRLRLRLRECQHTLAFSEAAACYCFSLSNTGSVCECYLCFTCLPSFVVQLFPLQRYSTGVSREIEYYPAISACIGLIRKIRDYRTPSNSFRLAIETFEAMILSENPR
jgi:hypothetical protein